MQSGFDPGAFASLFSGLFGNAGSPAGSAMGPYSQYMNQAAGQLNPFAQGGQQAMGQYQNWLSGMSDPSGFMNKMMGQYQSSPWAQTQQRQALNAGNAAASASGLGGSSAMNQQMQQNAGQISSQDQNNWLGNVMGINSQYGQGLGNMMNMGEGAANSLAGLYQNYGQGMGNLAYGQQQGNNQDMSNIFGGLAGIGSMFL